MNESSDHIIRYSSTFFGFTVEVKILLPSSDLYVLRLTSRGFKPTHDLDYIAKRYAQQAARALEGTDLALLKELAEEQGVALRISMKTPDGSITTKKVRGRQEPDFSFRRGRGTGSIKPAEEKDQQRREFEKQIEDKLRKLFADSGTEPTKTKVAQELGIGGRSPRTGNDTSLSAFNNKLRRLNVDYEEVVRRVRLND